MTKTMISLSLVALLAAACGGDDSVDILNKTPTEAANEVADALCNANVACGDVSVECSSTETGLECTGEITPVTYMECYDDLQMDIEEDFTNCALTDAQKQTVNDCVNAMLALPCITQTEIDAYIEDIEAGDENATLGPGTPAVCDQLEAVFEGCQPS